MILLTDNVAQFVSKLFVSVCSKLGVKNTTTTEYHQIDTRLSAVLARITIGGAMLITVTMYRL